MALVKEAARLPDVTTAQLSDSSMTVRVRRAESMAGPVAWLREAPALGFKWVYVGDSASWWVAIEVTDDQGVSDEMIATSAKFAETHPRLDNLTVSRSSVSGVLPTKAEAHELLAAFEQTAPDGPNQEVSVWWPDGNGTAVSGQVGSAVATR